MVLDLWGSFLEREEQREQTGLWTQRVESGLEQKVEKALMTTVSTAQGWGRRPGAGQRWRVLKPGAGRCGGTAWAGHRRGALHFLAVWGAGPRPQASPGTP